MLIVRPVQSKADQEKYCADCGAVYDADCLAYAAWVDERLVGICQFRLAGDGGHIVTLRRALGTDDVDALFIMARQTMNFIDLSGVHAAWYDEPEPLTSDFPLRLGFTPRSGGYYADLTTFFTSPCEHGKAGSAL